ncbi:MAG: hypothetical protein FJ096_18425 [Deltaproteobacteria bacterium]|nr:hypothetical protein [Deltaproteobacteria bacterium]
MFISALTRKLAPPALAAVSAFLLTGCPSMPMMTTAKTIGDGKNQVTISPGVVGFSGGVFGAAAGASASTGGTILVPDLMLAYRRGIGDSFDLGIGLSGFGKFSLDGKVNFLGNGKSDKFALAIDPTFGGVILGVGSIGAGYLDYGLPILLDLAPNDWFRATLAPRYRGNFFFAAAQGETDSRVTHYLGSGLGAEFTLNDTVQLQPHAAFDVLLNPPPTRRDGVEMSSSAVALTGGLAVKLNF